MSGGGGGSGKVHVTWKREGLQRVSGGGGGGGHDGKVPSMEERVITACVWRCRWSWRKSAEWQGVVAKEGMVSGKL